MKKKNKITKRIVRNNLVAYSFIIVSIVTLFVLVYIPTFTTVNYSFHNIGIVGFGENEFVGLDNYRTLITNSTFSKAIGNTILMAVMGLLTIPVGFILAVLINSLGRGKLQEFFRVGFYLPNIITGVSVYLIFRVVLMSDGGLLNNALSAIVGHKVMIGWLADPKFARWGVTIIWVWMNAGYSMLMNLASLQAIPTDLYEAASIDGANAIQKLISITIPNMKSCFALLFVTGMINGLARFTDIFILGGMDCYGGAGGTLQTILMYVYQYSFETPNYGIASAGAMVLFVLVFIMTMVNVKLTGFLKDEV
jgi:ABC-type sugar transport system permease subunit